MLSGMKVLTADPSCPASVEVSFAVSFAVALLALVPGLLFTLMADPIVRGATLYPRLHQL